MSVSSERVFDSRREELADLLRLRRGALKSRDVGLPEGRRRRTPGLRREEVAELAGVSYSMYVALEQGRQIPVSLVAIDAIARALRLSESERLHARRLVERTQPDLREQVSSRLERFVVTNAIPMYVLNHAWDIILMNDAAGVLFNLNPDMGVRQNALLHAYLVRKNRSLFDNWRTMARSLTEAFRLEAAQSVDPRVAAVVDRLLAESEEFAEDWKMHGVREHPRDVYRLIHPNCGVLAMEPSAYRVLESPNLRVMAFTLSDTESVMKIRRLVDALRNR